MPRPSEPLLAWLREKLKEKSLNVAHVATTTGLERGRLRRILKGSEGMTVDELMTISDTLQLDPADLTIPDTATTTPVPSAPASVDPFGNQPEQLFRIAFDLGCDFLFLASIDQLDDSGVPAAVLAQYTDLLPIHLQAAYHQYNEPRYDRSGVTLTLSFDALYECSFPWTAIRRIVFEPVSPEIEPDEEVEPPSEASSPAPFLRLVT